jgi:hypothetical protein
MQCIQKYSDDQLIENTDIASQKCQESISEIFDVYRGNVNVTDTIKTIFRYQNELYSRVKSMHLQNKILTDGNIKYRDDEISDLKQKLTDLEIEQRDPNKSSYEFVKEIDKGMEDLFQNRIKTRKNELENKRRFSGVDFELGEVYKYLDFIGRSNISEGFYPAKNMPFDSFKEFITNQAKSIQINASKKIGKFVIIIYSFVNDQRRTYDFLLWNTR